MVVIIPIVHSVLGLEEPEEGLRQVLVVLLVPMDVISSAVQILEQEVMVE